LLCSYAELVPDAHVRDTVFGALQVRMIGGPPKGCCRYRSRHSSRVLTGHFSCNTFTARVLAHAHLTATAAQAEYELTVRLALEIKGQRHLLEDQPGLAASIRTRFPYLDPLNHLQVELLRAYRAGQTDERTVRAIHLSINGLSAGLRNSG
jgi:hypothetical protein